MTAQRAWKREIEIPQKWTTFCGQGCTTFAENEKAKAKNAQSLMPPLRSHTAKHQRMVRRRRIKRYYRFSREIFVLFICLPGFSFYRKQCMAVTSKSNSSASPQKSRKTTLICVNSTHTLTHTYQRCYALVCYRGSSSCSIPPFAFCVTFCFFFLSLTHTYIYPYIIYIHTCIHTYNIQTCNQLTH